eukprot:1945336-Pleurochrysis_carterae.AAC.6
MSFSSTDHPLLGTRAEPAPPCRGPAMGKARRPPASTCSAPSIPARRPNVSRMSALPSPRRGPLPLHQQLHHWGELYVRGEDAGDQLIDLILHRGSQLLLAHDAHYARSLRPLARAGYLRQAACWCTSRSRRLPPRPRRLLRLPCTHVTQRKKQTYVCKKMLFGTIENAPLTGPVGGCRECYASWAGAGKSSRAAWGRNAA